MLSFIKKLFRKKSLDEKLFLKELKTGSGEKLTASEWLEKVPNDKDKSLIRYMSKIIPGKNFETFKAPNSLWATFYAKLDEEKFTAAEYWEVYCRGYKLICKTDPDQRDFENDWLDFAKERNSDWDWSEKEDDWNYRLSEDTCEKIFAAWMKKKEIEFLIDLDEFLSTTKVDKEEFVNYIKELNGTWEQYRAAADWNSLVCGMKEYKAKLEEPKPEPVKKEKKRKKK